MEKKNGKKLSKFMSKLGSLVHKSKPDCSKSDYDLPAMPGLSPLSAANNPFTRKKQQQLSINTCRAHDDCGQILASSDQASQAARIEEQPQDSYASEHYGSECSLSESVRAASAHMAQLRNILVNHISETHDARSSSGKLAGPNLLAALHKEQQQCSTSLERLSGFSGRASTSSRLPPGSTSTDRKVEALLADQMQLLDLVHTLIADHRNSLLEQQRLQKQLAATQEALHSERLDKDRAAALAHVRFEQVSKVEADLAAASETMQQLRVKRAISIKQVQLPSALAAASEGCLNAEESIVSDKAEWPAAGVQVGCSQQGLTPCRTSAMIGRIAPEDSWQDMAAIVGPAPVNSVRPLSAGAAAVAPLAPKCSRGSNNSQGKESNRSSKTSGFRSNKSSGSRISRRHKAEGQERPAPRQRRLLGDTPTSSSNSGSAAGVDAAHAAVGAGNAAAGAALQQQSSSRSSQQSLRSPGVAAVHVQVVQEQQQPKQDLQQLPPVPSAAAKIAQKQASALELLLLQRLSHSSCTADANAQLRQLLHNSIETETSSLSIAWAGTVGDAAAAPVGLTKQQLHQLLHRPWLPTGSQGCVLSPEQSAAILGASASANTAVVPACPKRKQWQRPPDTRRQAGAAAADGQNSEGDDTESCSSVEQDSDSGSDLDSNGESTDSDADMCSESSDDGLDPDHGSDGSETSRSDSSSSGSDCSSIAAVEQHTHASKPSAAGNTSVAMADRGKAGSRCLQQQPEQPTVHGSTARQAANVHSSNGSSWPGMKASLFALNPGASLLAAAQPGCKSSLSPHNRTQKHSSRSRTQPLQISTSLESAETLSLATTATVQHGAGSRSASRSSSLAMAAAAACPHCSTDAAACACSCCAAGSGRGRSRGSGTIGGGSSSGRIAAKRSAEMLQPCSEQNQESVAYKRKLAPGADATTTRQQQTAAGAVASRQRQRVTQQLRPAPPANAQLIAQPSGPRAPPAAVATADHGCDSDGEMSVASAATGCTTLSNLAGIDLQTKSQAKPRPDIVPKLNLPFTAQQQQQGVSKQAASGVAAGNPNRALRLAQESDMAPLMAQTGSNRNRGKTTPRQTPRNTAEATGAAANAATQVERAGGSFSCMGASGSTLGGVAVRAHSFTAGQERQQRKHGCATAATAAAAGQTAHSSPSHISRSKRSSAPGSGSHVVTATSGAGSCSNGCVAAACVGSANGSSSGTGHYWGSSAGSYPASEEPSRQPTPTGEFVVPIYIPAAAGLPPQAAAAVVVAPTSTVETAERAGDEHGLTTVGRNAAAGELDEVASEGAGVGTERAAQQFYQPLPAAQQAVQMLTITTPRGASLTPGGLTPSSAAAAAAGSYMTMRPAHMYKSVSTVYAMYSPLRGGLRALGQTKPGASGVGTTAAGAAATAFNCEQTGLADGVGEFRPAALQQQQHQQQLLDPAGMLGVREPSTGNASEHHWQALLGTVPEEEGVVYCEAVHEQAAAAAAGCSGTFDHSEAATAGSAAATISDPVLLDGRQGSLGTAMVLSSPSPISGGSDSEPYPYVQNKAALPTRRDFQLMLQQEQQQQYLAQQQQPHERFSQPAQEQQQQQQRRERLAQPAQEQQQQQQVDKDVVDRGPLFRPDSTSPPLAARASAARHSSATICNNRQQHSSRRSSLTIQTGTGAATGVDGGAIGPLTASSPTRRRNNANSSSVASNTAARSTLGTAEVQQQHRRSQSRSMRRAREQTVANSSREANRASCGRVHNSHDASVSAATVARVEAAAAAVAARVAAVAARHSSRQQHNTTDAEQLSTSEGVGAVTTAAVTSDNSQVEHLEQQQERTSRSQRFSITRSRSASSEQGPGQPAKQQHRQQKQQQGAGSGASTDPRSRRSRHSRTGSGSSRRNQAAAFSDSSNIGNQLDSRQASTEMVTSYHNPLVTLEEAGLSADDDAALVYAGLIPGFAPAAAQAAASSPAAVAAAAVNHVPAHVTPLAKEHSREGAGTKDGCVPNEQSGAGGSCTGTPYMILMLSRHHPFLAMHSKTCLPALCMLKLHHWSVRQDVALQSESESTVTGHAQDFVFLTTYWQHRQQFPKQMIPAQ